VRPSLACFPSRLGQGLVTRRRSNPRRRPRSQPAARRPADPHTAAGTHRRAARRTRQARPQTPSRRGRVAIVRRDGMEALKKAEKTTRSRRRAPPEIHKYRSSPTATSSRSTTCGDQGKEIRRSDVDSAAGPQSRLSVGPLTSHHPWMATAVGQSRVACRGWPVTGAEPKRCGR